MGKFFIIFISIVIIHNVGFSIEYETLINFRQFEFRINNENIYEINNEDFRLNYFLNPNSITENEIIKYKSSYIPWFKITPQDMAFDRWVISYHFPHNYHHPNPKLTNRSQTPYDKGNNQNYLPAARIFFPTIAEDMTAYVQPPYEIYPFSKNGKLTNIGNGVLLNVGDVEKVLLTMGFKKGNIEDIMITVTVEDFRGVEYDYPMGFMFSKKDGVIRYYRNFDGQKFRVEDLIENKEELNNLETYYTVIYKKKTNEEIEKERKEKIQKLKFNNPQADTNTIEVPKEKLVLWSMIKNGREVYSELTFEWVNSKYLEPYKKSFEKKGLYPNEIPFIKFKHIKVKRQGGSKRQFYLFFKEIKMKYDSLSPQYIMQPINTNEINIVDDLEWQILKEYYLEKRKFLEAKHAWMMYKTFKKGWRKGFSNYDMFKNLYLMRFPPEGIQYP